MGKELLERISVTPLRRIPVDGGDVLHAIRRDDPGFAGFGEAYFSWAHFGTIKAWKRHTRMTLNLIVPIGSVRFVFWAPEGAAVRAEVIGDAHYSRLTVPPGIWFGFAGLAVPRSLVLNIADIPHDPAEVERMAPGDFPYDWAGAASVIG